MTYSDAVNTFAADYIVLIYGTKMVSAYLQHPIVANDSLEAIINKMLLIWAIKRHDKEPIGI